METTITKINDLIEEVKKETRKEVLNEVLSIVTAMKNKAYERAKLHEERAIKNQSEIDVEISEDYISDMCAYMDIVFKLEVLINKVGK